MSSANRHGTDRRPSRTGRSAHRPRRSAASKPAGPRRRSKDRARRLLSLGPTGAGVTVRFAAGAVGPHTMRTVDRARSRDRSGGDPPRATSRQRMTTVEMNSSAQVPSFHCAVESLPGGLPGHAQSRSDPCPAQSSIAGGVDPGGQVHLDLSPGGCDLRQPRQESCVVEPRPRRRGTVQVVGSRVMVEELHGLFGAGTANRGERAGDQATGLAA